MPRHSVRRYLSLQRFPVALLLLSLFKQLSLFLDAAHSDGGNLKFIVSSGRLAGILLDVLCSVCHVVPSRALAALD